MEGCTSNLTRRDPVAVFLMLVPTNQVWINIKGYDSCDRTNSLQTTNSLKVKDMYQKRRCLNICLHQSELQQTDLNKKPRFQVIYLNQIFQSERFFGSFFRIKRLGFYATWQSFRISCACDQTQFSRSNSKKFKLGPCCSGASVFLFNSAQIQTAVAFNEPQTIYSRLFCLTMTLTSLVQSHFSLSLCSFTQNTICHLLML